MKTAMLHIFLSMLLVSCTGDHETPVAQTQQPDSSGANYKYLALGDSYTIGESVYADERFPAQLKKNLESSHPNWHIDLQYIAQTGWTTTNLKGAITTQNPASDFDLVTLLIGVNNQYQHKPFSVYEQEFPELVAKSIALAKGNRSNVIVVSIPDYRYTPFGNGSGNPEQISAEIDQYNAFAASYCASHNIVFVNITDITRLGLQNTLLVASDGLHPSKYAYAQFADRLLQPANNVLTN